MNLLKQWEWDYIEKKDDHKELRYVHNEIWDVFPEKINVWLFEDKRAEDCWLVDSNTGSEQKNVWLKDE